MEKKSSLKEILGDLTIGDGPIGAPTPPRLKSNISEKRSEITAEQGVSGVDGMDEDVKTHSDILHRFFEELHSNAQNNVIDLKKRLIEEKQVALMEAERTYLNQYDMYQTEINGLRNDIRMMEMARGRVDHLYDGLTERSINLMNIYHYRHRSDFSVNRMFQLWKQEMLETKRADRMDRIAKSFWRKHIMAKAFLSMCLNIQKKKTIKIHSEWKFKFDSVTNEVIKRYESEIEQLREDLKDAYQTVELEQVRRQQLEEDLRRLFLKNMTSMNLEALSLFQSSHALVEDVHAQNPSNSNAASMASYSGTKREKEAAATRTPSKTPSRSGPREGGGGNGSISSGTAGVTSQSLTGHPSTQSSARHRPQTQQAYEQLINTTGYTPMAKPPPVAQSTSSAASYSGHGSQSAALGTSGEVMEPTPAPRPPLPHSSIGGGAGVDSGLQNSHTDMLRELYKANMATTTRLAHMQQQQQQPGYKQQQPAYTHQQPLQRQQYQQQQQHQQHQREDVGRRSPSDSASAGWPRGAGW